MVRIRTAKKYAVEGIEKHRIRFNAVTKRPRREYLVKWRNYGAEENTWEPLCNLRGNCSNLIFQFHLKHPENGPSPVQETAGRSNANQTEWNESLWPTNEEVFVYLKKIYKEHPLVHVYHPVKEPALKDGLNIAIMFLESHAFTIIRIVNINGLEDMVYIGDSLNHFKNEEGGRTHQKLAHDLLSEIGVDHAQIIIHQQQTRNDTCAYSGLAALQESVKLILECDQVPGLITYPTSRVGEIMKEFGRDPAHSQSEQKGQFHTDEDNRKKQECSFCTSYVRRAKQAYQGRRMHEILTHRKKSCTNLRSKNVIRRQ